jgi:hypothetical protein
MSLLWLRSFGVACVAVARRSDTYVQVADLNVTGPDVWRCCCATRLSFVFSELSREVSLQHDILRSRRRGENWRLIPWITIASSFQNSKIENTLFFYKDRTDFIWHWRIWKLRSSFSVCILQNPPLWSMVWLRIHRSGFDSRHYRILLEVVDLERGSLSLVSKAEEILERNLSGSSLESREYSSRGPSLWPRGTLHSQKLALTSSTSSGRYSSLADSDHGVIMNT